MITVVLKPKSKINEILDELNRTNKSLNDLSKVIAIHSPKEGIKSSCDLNGGDFENTKSSLSQKTNFNSNHTKTNSYDNGEAMINARNYVNIQEFNSNISDGKYNDNPFTSAALNNELTSSTKPSTPITVDDKQNVTHRTKNVNKYYNDLGNKCATDVDFDINCSVNNKNNNIYHDTISKGNINNDDINITINNNAVKNHNNNKENNNGNSDNISSKTSSGVDKDSEKANDDFDIKKDNKDVEENETNEERRAIFIVGDSMVKELKGFELSKSIGHKKLVKVRSHPGATIRCLTDHLQPIIRNKDAEHILLHIGTNDLKLEKTPVQICHEIINLAAAIRDKDFKVSVSGIIQRNDHLNNKHLLVNDSLKEICGIVGIPFVSNGTIRPDFYLNASGLHLNKKDNNVFISNIRKLCKSVLQADSGNFVKKYYLNSTSSDGSDNIIVT